MRILSFIFIFFIAFNTNAQEEREQTLNNLPNSIYFSSFEKEFSPIKFAFYNTHQLDSYQFIKFDKARMVENLSNSIYFNDIGRKPSKYYLDTYKKVYDLKGQQAAFLKIESLYEVPPQYQNTKRNK